ncbi:MAG: aminotransferase class I/II-fold pyridoxal phosphate-dependent enzyme, partial [Terriglobales bacterium]
LLTTPNPEEDADRALLRELGLEGEAAQTSCPLPVAGWGKTQAPVLLAQQEWAEELERLRAQGRKRELRENCGQDFCSNDYLGLAAHPGIREAMARALRDGIELGSTGSRLVRGNHPAFEALERHFADWRGTEAALFFSSGYAAGVGVLTALIGPKDIVFSDAANHASLIDGLRLSGARRVVFPHNELDALRTAMLRHPATNAGKRFLVIESLYSMEGDRAAAAAMAELCREQGVAMIVDEAHATGLFAAVDYPDVVVASLHPCGKALGGSGCLVAGSGQLRQYLINRSRSFIFSTAPSPLLAVQLFAALEVITREPGRREQVFALARALRQGLGMEIGDSPIVPMVLGRDEDATAAAAELVADGFDVRAIRPPTVPEGTARLRLTVHAGQSLASVDKLCRAVSSRVLIPA